MLVTRKNDNVIIASGSDIDLNESGMRIGKKIDRGINTSNAVLYSIDISPNHEPNHSKYSEPEGFSYTVDGEAAVLLGKKEKALEKIAELILLKRDLGVEINGKFIYTDGTAREMLSGEYNAGAGDVQFKSRSGPRVSMTRAEFNSFYLAFHSYIKGVEARGFALDELVEGAVSISGLDSIDIYSGWPSTVITISEP